MMLNMMKWRCLSSFLLLAVAAAAAGPEFLSVEPARDLPPAIRIPGGPQLEPAPAVVGRYEKFELQIDMQAEYANPFDPDEIDLWAEFTAPSGKVWKIWGFYNPSSWSALWMVRFSPPETGAWRYVVKARDRTGTAQSGAGSFQAVESEHLGHISIAPNKRYLRHADGTSFYGVGMWYNDSYEEFQQGRITEAGLDDLKLHGANFISFFHTPLETMGSGLGRYDQNRAGRLDELFEWCEERDLRISWNIWFHSYISRAVWGGGNARYRNNPYSLIAKAEDWFASDEAWKYQEKLYRYIVARWGYSRSLFLWFLVDEINGTEGFRDREETANEWSRKIHEWFKANDPYGRPTTGTRSGGIDQWWAEGYAIFDVAAREIYEAQGHPMPEAGKPDRVNEDPVRYSYLNYVKQNQDLWKGFEKPLINGETGYDHTYYEPGMPEYVAIYHNAIWTSMATGLCATPFWWSYGDFINDGVVTNTMLHFAHFVSDIDFAAASWKPVAVTMSDGDGWALTSEGMTVGWVVNTLAGAANETVVVEGLPDGAYDVYLYRTWRGAYLDPATVETTAGRLTFVIPELRTERGHANHIGNDVAFKIVPKGASRIQQ